MGFRSNFPLITITIRRDQKDWIASQNTLNFSGWVQEELDKLIAEKEKQKRNLYRIQKDAPVITSNN